MAEPIIIPFATEPDLQFETFFGRHRILPEPGYVDMHTWITEQFRDTAERSRALDTEHING